MRTNLDYYKRTRYHIIPFSEIELEECYGLRVGDILPENIISKWAGNNNCYYFQEWKKSNVGFVNDRKILSFKVLNGILGFEVSNTLNIFLKAEGFKEFMDRYSLPEKWYLPTTGFDYKTLDSLNNWRKDQLNCTFKDRGLYDCVLLSKHHNDNSYYQEGVFSFNKYHYYNDYKKITLSQFKNTYPKYFKENQITNKTMKNLIFKLQFNDAQSIIKIACKGDWQPKLIKLWSEDLLLKGEVEITEEFYQEMIKASTSDQKTLLNSIFKDFFGKKIDLFNPDTINGLNVFNESGIDSMITIKNYGDFEKEVFILHKDFNWEIKKVSDNKSYILIPIKK